MTPKLAGRLDYNAQTLAALAKWADNGEKKKPKRYGRKWCVKKATKAPKN